jgi:predicted small metal-binding protein
MLRHPLRRSSWHASISIAASFRATKKCSVTIAADSEQELMEVAVQHAVSVHGHQDTPEFRQQLKATMHEGRRRL